MLLKLKAKCYVNKCIRLLWYFLYVVYIFFNVEDDKILVSRRQSDRTISHYERSQENESQSFGCGIYGIDGSLRSPFIPIDDNSSFAYFSCHLMRIVMFFFIIIYLFRNFRTIYI